MSKNKKRQSRSTPVTAAAISIQTPRPARTALSSAEFNPDYKYVISDLKRIAILASFFITVLVVLSFFLR